MFESRVYAKSSNYKVIITSFLFPSGKFSLDRLQSVLKALDNDTSKLVIDLSCRRKGDTWFVAMNKWQDLTDMELTAGKSCAVNIPRIICKLQTGTFNF
jgi:phosphoribosylformimino-5-aminoimidazole carboxamide ribonucleotide (ProFAR) isomerase